MELPDILWIIFNLILILYAISLFIYGKYFRKKDPLTFKNVIDDNKILYRNDSDLNLIEGEENDKKENLI